MLIAVLKFSLIFFISRTLFRIFQKSSFYVKEIFYYQFTTELLHFFLAIVLSILYFDNFSWKLSGIILLKCVSQYGIVLYSMLYQYVTIFFRINHSKIMIQLKTWCLSYFGSCCIKICQQKEWRKNRLSWFTVWEYNSMW